MKYKGIIFDLDGTIIDTVEDLNDSVNGVLKEKNLPPVTLKETRENIGNGMLKLIQRSVPEEYKEDYQFLEQCVDRLLEIYQKRLVNKSKAYPNIQEFLKFCNSNNILLGVASNKSGNETNQLLSKIFPDIIFTKALGHQKGRAHKPDPAIIDEILKAMKLNKDEVLYVGDSYTDYLTAKNSDLDCILVTYGYEKEGILDNLPVLKLLNTSSELVDSLKKFF